MIEKNNPTISDLNKSLELQNKLKKFILDTGMEIGYQEVEVTGWKDTLAKSYRYSFIDGQKRILDDLMRITNGLL